MQWKATPSLKAQAARLLNRTGAKTAWEVERFSTYERIRTWRSRARQYPGDALAWLELAFYRTIAGQHDAAKVAMAAALRYAPDNRHVLRSAGRFYLHVGDLDQAHRVLVRSDATKHDPWLMAAEISLAEIAGNPSRFAKAGLGVVAAGKFLPKHIAELAAAVGTLELVSGNRRAARKIFTKSLVAPTGNSLAQVEWASSGFGEDLVSEDRIMGAFERSEALALHRYQEWRFSEIPALCEVWAKEEPYSVRPFEFGAAAAGFAGDHDTARLLAEEGLKMRPGSAPLSNSLAFSLASLGRTQEAAAALKGIGAKEETDFSKLISAANFGLIAFRSNQTEEGLALYQTAVDGFRAMKDRRSAASALCYLARESARASIPEAPALYAKASEAWKAVDNRQHPALKSADLSASLLADSASEEQLLKLTSTTAWRLT